MSHSDSPDPTRRELLRSLALAPIVLASSQFLAGCAGGANRPSEGTTRGNAQTAEPTLACGDDDDGPTIAQTEGPYFTPSSPERASLVDAGMTGTLLTVTGRVLDRRCQPITRALLDFWQCDDAGQYDNSGFRLRGHQFSDSSGQYRLATIVPGVYPGRTRHIHVKVQAPNRPILTTQLYFPGEPRNLNDGIFHQSLLLAMTETGGSRTGRFDFVLDIG